MTVNARENNNFSINTENRKYWENISGMSMVFQFKVHSDSNKYSCSLTSFTKIQCKEGNN
jgi:hypothetical protein